jgi:hypothetical protein
MIAGNPAGVRGTGASPKPGMLSSTWVCRCSVTFSLISASSSASSLSRVMMSRARAATICYPRCWAGTVVCWDFAASMAAWATAAEERVPCFFSQACSLVCPVRRIPSGGREENQMRRIGSSDKSRPFRQEMGMIRFLQAL